MLRSEPISALVRAPTTSTRERILRASLLSFGARGYEATALDFVAASLGVRKQTILHHFRSKELLLSAVSQEVTGRLTDTMETALARPGTGTQRLERVIRAVFALAAREPELLSFARELARLGGVPLREFTEMLAPLMLRATSFLQGEVISLANPNNGSPDADAHAVVLAAYAAILGAATEAEVRASVGLRPSGRLLLRRRREVLAYITHLMQSNEAIAMSEFVRSPTNADGAATNSSQDAIGAVG